MKTVKINPWLGLRLAAPDPLPISAGGVHLARDGGQAGVDDKSCNTCHETKPLTSYFKHPRSTDGYGYECMACLRKRNKTNTQKRKLKP